MQEHITHKSNILIRCT